MNNEKPETIKNMLDFIQSRSLKLKEALEQNKQREARNILRKLRRQNWKLYRAVKKEKNEYLVERTRQIAAQIQVLKGNLLYPDKCSDYIGMMIKLCMDDLEPKEGEKFIEVKQRKWGRGVRLFVYHGASTGKNMESLHSFREKGIDPKLASGYGQGNGFFVWTEKGKALNYALAMKYSKKEYPIIVSFFVEITPEEYDFDYEISGDAIALALRENWETIKSILPERIPYNITASNFGKKLKNESGFINIKKTSPIGNTLLSIIREDAKKVYTMRREYTLSPTFIDIYGGGLLGSIFNTLQKIDPSFAHKLEADIFKKEIAFMRKFARALKYVGSKKLPIYKIEAYIDDKNKWIDVTKKDPPKK